VSGFGPLGHSAVIFCSVAAGSIVLNCVLFLLGVLLFLLLFWSDWGKERNKSAAVASGSDLLQAAA